MPPQNRDRDRERAFWRTFGSVHGHALPPCIDALVADGPCIAATLRLRLGASADTDAEADASTDAATTSEGVGAHTEARDARDAREVRVRDAREVRLWVDLSDGTLTAPTVHVEGADREADALAAERVAAALEAGWSPATSPGALLVQLLADVRQAAEADENLS